MLDKVIRRSDVVDKESLCILAGQRVSISVLSLTGFLFFFNVGLAFTPKRTLPIGFRKSTGLCVPSRHCRVKTLSQTRCRSNWRRGDSGMFEKRFVSKILSKSFSQHHPTSRAPIPLSLHHNLYCFTFAFFSDTSIHPVLDPNHLEQRLNGGLISIALNAHRELCVVQKSGGVPLEPADVLRIVNVAVQKAKDLDVIVESRLREDWEGRKVEVR